MPETDLRPYQGYPEVQQILDRLRPKRFLLVTVSGKPGIGKSAFIAEALTLAEEQQGWRAIGKGNGELEIDSSTTKEFFLNRLLNRLAASGVGNASSSEDETEDLMDRLKQASPAVIGIGRFWPSEEFLAWFSGDFIPALRNSAAAVAILCGGLHTGRLSAVADYQVNLDRLDDHWARERLTAAAAKLTPPLETEELDQYAKELSVRPELLISFLRVFRLGEANL